MHPKERSHPKDLKALQKVSHHSSTWEGRQRWPAKCRPSSGPGMGARWWGLAHHPRGSGVSPSPCCQSGNGPVGPTTKDLDLCERREGLVDAVVHVVLNGPSKIHSITKQGSTLKSRALQDHPVVVLQGWNGISRTIRGICVKCNPGPIPCYESSPSTNVNPRMTSWKLPGGVVDQNLRSRTRAVV